MSMSYKQSAVGLVLAGAIALPAAAHHAFSAEFDSKQPIELTGTISRFVLTNPHSWLYVDVTDDAGNVTRWGFEFGTPFSLQKNGITKQTLAPGLKVTIKGYRAKNGKEFGYATSTVLEDGRSFSTGGAPDAPAAQAARN